MCDPGRSRKLRVSSWLHVIVPRVWFMGRVRLSFAYPFWCGYFPCCPMCRSHSSSSGFLSEGIVPCTAVYLGYLWEERKVRSLLCHHLVNVYFRCKLSSDCQCWDLLFWPGQWHQTTKWELSLSRFVSADQGYTFIYLCDLSPRCLYTPGRWRSCLVGKSYFQFLAKDLTRCKLTGCKSTWVQRMNDGTGHFDWFWLCNLCFVNLGKRFISWSLRFFLFKMVGLAWKFSKVPSLKFHKWIYGG